MIITDIIHNSAKPALYEKGSSVMWTDPHISAQLLDIHLNPDLDLASRKISTISNTAEWILANTREDERDILDLGCDPGLYAEFLARKGHHVTGVDFSEHSIKYARQEIIGALGESHVKHK